MKKILLFLLLAVFSVILVAQTETIRKNLNYTGSVNFAGAVKIGSVTITASGAELNFVDNVTSAIQTQLDAKVKSLPDTLLITDAYGLILANTGRTISATKATVVVITIPLNSSQAIPVGSTINFFQGGAGILRFKPTAGVVLRSKLDSIATGGIWGWAALYKRGTNNWILYGDISD